MKKSKKIYFIVLAVLIAVQLFRYKYRVYTFGEIVKQDGQSYILFQQDDEIQQGVLGSDQNEAVKDIQLVLLSYAPFKDGQYKLASSLFVPKSIVTSPVKTQSFRSYPSKAELKIRRCPILFMDRTDLEKERTVILKADTLTRNIKYTTNKEALGYPYTFEISKKEAQLLPYQKGDSVTIYFVKGAHHTFYIE